MHTCPHCGAALERKARFCRECGSDESTGWSPEAETGGWEPPAMEDFDYEDYLAREFQDGARGGARARARSRVRWLWIAVLGLFLWVVLFR